ncbi:pyrroline-5-carboxylate reductase [Segnochrobactraceae bacterium EtOH-i3]
MTTSSSPSALASAGPLLLVGAGKMGGALLSGWLRGGLAPADVTVVDPFLAPELAAELDAAGVTHRADPPPAGPFATLVLAVKPQMMGAVLPQLAALRGPDTLVISIAAGTTLATLTNALGAGPTVRVMPNTPAMIGHGTAGAVAGPGVSAAGRAVTHALMTAVGTLDWVETEAGIDAVTALSGSGPAYVFHLVEAMAAAGEKLGLAPDLAMRLARSTVAGAGALLDASELDAATLRKNVTSPGGTTAAALAVLMTEPSLTSLMTQAIAAAERRSRELAG